MAAARDNSKNTDDVLFLLCVAFHFVSSTSAITNSKLFSTCTAHEKNNLLYLVEGSLLNVAQQHLAYFGERMPLDKTIQNIREVFTNRHLQRSYGLKVQVERIKTIMTEMEMNLGEFVNISDKISVEKDLTIIHDKDQTYLYPTTMFMCALDNIQVRFHLQLNVLIKEVDEKIRNLFGMYV